MLIVKPVVEMRKNPCKDAEVISQALFGEKVDQITQENNWSKITTEDRYTGWVESSSLQNTSFTPTVYTCSKAAPVYAQKDIRFGPMLILPIGVGLCQVDTSDEKWVEVVLPSKEIGFIQKGNVAPLKRLSKNELAAFAKKFLSLPYIWGGRSSFGYDCSGFVQMLYKQIGVLLPRDACDQIKDPRLKERAKLADGDLIFWGKSCDKIEHVGLYLGDGSFIHATNQEQMPWIRISSLTDVQWDPNSSSIYPYRCYIGM